MAIVNSRKEKVNGQVVIHKDVAMIRGDSEWLIFDLTDESGEPLPLTEHDTIHCQVRTAPNDGDLLFEGVIQGDQESLEWYIRPDDTASVPVGRYFWDAQVEYGESGDVITVIPSSYFDLLDEVTRRGGE